MIGSKGVQPTGVILFLAILMNHEHVDSLIVQGPSDTTAMVNRSTYFNCTTSISPVDERSVTWFHFPLDGGGQRNYIYDDGRIMTNYKNRFAIDIDLSSGEFNLLVMRLEIKDAGRYECRDDILEGQGASAALTVSDSDLVCESDLHPDGVVGPTQCDRVIAPDELHLSCRVTYNGNNAPQMVWRKAGDSSTSTKTDCVTSYNRVTCNTTLIANLQLNGAVYICELTKQQYNCSLEIKNVLYVFANTTKTQYHTGDEVTCVANASRKLPCTYQWYKDDSTEPSSYEKLKPSDPGLYSCQAHCTIRHDSCKFTAMVINVSTAPLPGTNLNYLWSVLFFFAVIIGVILMIRFRSRWLGQCRRNVKKPRPSSGEIQDSSLEMSHADAIQKNYDVLQRCTTINPYVIDFLRAEDVLSEAQEHDLRAERSHQRQSILLFQWLKEVSSDKYESFLQVMKNTEQEHVANLLTGSTEEDHLPLSDARYSRLVKSRNKLTSIIYTDSEIIAELRSLQAISMTDVDEISAETVDYARSSKLIGAILRRSNHSCSSFREVLRKTMQPAVAEFQSEGENDDSGVEQPI